MDEKRRVGRSAPIVPVPSSYTVVVCLALSLVACAPRPTSDLVHIPTLTGRPPPAKPPVVSLTEAPARSTYVEPVGRKKGEKIRVEWHGQLYPATVLGAAAGGLTRIHYDGYGAEWDEDVDEGRISAADDEPDE